MPVVSDAAGTVVAEAVAEIAETVVEAAAGTVAEAAAGTVAEAAAGTVVGVAGTAVVVGIAVAGAVSGGGQSCWDAWPEAGTEEQPVGAAEIAAAAAGTAAVAEIAGTCFLLAGSLASPATSSSAAAPAQTVSWPPPVFVSLAPAASSQPLQPAVPPSPSEAPCRSHCLESPGPDSGTSGMHAPFSHRKGWQTGSWQTPEQQQEEQGTSH